MAATPRVTSTRSRRKCGKPSGSKITTAPCTVPVVRPGRRPARTLARALANAVQNAGQDSPITITAEPFGEGTVLLMIADHGPGVPPDTLDRLFDPFFRPVAARTRETRSDDGRLLVGWGMATSSYPAVQMPAQATVSLWADGTVVVRSATHELGTGTYTAMTQLAADALGLPMEKVRLELGDSAFSMAPINGGSWLTSSVGPAVLAACAALKQRLAELALADADSPLKGAQPEDLTLADNRLFITADPARALPVSEIFARAGLAQIEAAGSAKPGAGDEERYAHFSFGAVFAEVTVDPDLGETRVRRIVGVYDAGRILNPTLARSQLIGGTVFGLSMALQEMSAPDPHSGRTVNANLAEYHVPVHADMPPGGFDVSFLNEPDPHFGGGLGAHGVGEPGIVGSVAAVANAVFHATGKRVRDLPITPGKLL